MSHQSRYQQWICFEIANETYAHMVTDVQEILSYVRPVPVPGSTKVVEGVLNIRGEIVTVISARRYLGLEKDTIQAEHIIVLLTHTGPIGIIVDKVLQIRMLDHDKIKPLDNMHDNTPISGTLEYQGQLLILTDVNRCIHLQENL